MNAKPPSRQGKNAKERNQKNSSLGGFLLATWRLGVQSIDFRCTNPLK
jgi:hypothetical protein